MKKLFAVAALAFGMFGASAQTKIGYINTDELISIMPEAAKADGELKEYQQSLIQQGQEINKDADEKTAQFIKDSLKMSASMKEIKRNEIVQLITKAQNWNQTAQDMYNAKAAEKVDPIRKKALDAINAVAKEKGFSYVLDASTSVLLVFPPGDDLMPFVRTKLGIKDTPIAPKTGVGKPNN
jgi:outer membrane protein